MILIEHIGQDEDKYNDSQAINNGFKDADEHKVLFVGYFVLPGRILVAVGQQIPGVIDVPCLALVESQKGSMKETIEICQ